MLHNVHEGRSRDTFDVDMVDWLCVEAVRAPAQPAKEQMDCVFPSCFKFHDRSHCYICGHSAHADCIVAKLRSAVLARDFVMNLDYDFTCPVCAWIYEVPDEVAGHLAPVVASQAGQHPEGAQQLQLQQVPQQQQGVQQYQVPQQQVPQQQQQAQQQAQQQVQQQVQQQQQTHPQAQPMVQYQMQPQVQQQSCWQHPSLRALTDAQAMALMKEHIFTALPPSFYPFCALDWYPYVHIISLREQMRTRLLESIRTREALAPESSRNDLEAEGAHVLETLDYFLYTFSILPPPHNDRDMERLHLILTDIYSIRILGPESTAARIIYTQRSGCMKWPKFKRSYQKKLSDWSLEEAEKIEELNNETGNRRSRRRSKRKRS